jgi:hypothetical protein
MFVELIIVTNSICDHSNSEKNKQGLWLFISLWNMLNGKHGIPQPPLNLPHLHPASLTQKEKFRSQPYILLLPWYIIITLSNKVVSNGPKRRRQEGAEFGGGICFWEVFHPTPPPPPFSELEVWATQVGMRVVNHGHGSPPRAWVPHAPSVFIGLCISLWATGHGICSSVLAQRGPRGASTLGSLGPSNCSGKPSKAPPQRSF